MGELPHSLCLCLFTVSFNRREPLMMGVTTQPLSVSLHCQFQQKGAFNDGCYHTAFVLPHHTLLVWKKTQRKLVTDTMGGGRGDP